MLFKLKNLTCQLSLQDYFKNKSDVNICQIYSQSHVNTGHFPSCEGNKELADMKIWRLTSDLCWQLTFSFVSNKVLQNKLFFYFVVLCEWIKKSKRAKWIFSKIFRQISLFAIHQFLNIFACIGLRSYLGPPSGKHWGCTPLKKVN